MTTPEDLARELEADRGANRKLDARIAVALYDGGGHADPRDNTTARLPSALDDCAPGTYWISAFSGLSLRTAPDYTSDRTLKRLALTALQAQPAPQGDVVEAVARIINPGSWSVMDAEKARMLRKYKGQSIGWPADQFQHKESMAKAREILAALASLPSAEASFQNRVGKWMEQCFTSEIIADKLERSDRFIEEALELVQACGYDAARAHALVDYVFGRPVGDPAQEVGGVMVTLAALCNPHGLDMQQADEIRRSNLTNVELSKRYGLSQTCVRRVRNGETYKP